MTEACRHMVSWDPRPKFNKLGEYVPIGQTHNADHFHRIMAKSVRYPLLKICTPAAMDQNPLISATSNTPSAAIFGCYDKKMSEMSAVEYFAPQKSMRKYTKFGDQV